MVLPKSTAREIVEAYRKAFRDMRNDPAYKAGLATALGGYDQVTDAAAEALMREATTIPESARAWVREHLTKNYNVAF